MQLPVLNLPLSAIGQLDLHVQLPGADPYQFPPFHGNRSSEKNTV